MFTKTAWRNRIVMSTTIATLIVGAHSNAANAVDRIDAAGGPFTVAEGESLDIVLSLNEPVICVEADPCEVTLDFTDSFTDLDGLEAAEVIWDAADWAETRTITVVAGTDDSSSEGRTVTFSAIAESGSEYYSGFAVSIDVVVTDTQPDELADTGFDPALSGFIALGALSGGLALRAARSRAAKISA